MKRYDWGKSDGCFGLTLAVRALHVARQGPPTADDRPPVSVLPHTRASREALRLARERETWLRARRFRVVNRDGVIVRERASEAGSGLDETSATDPASLAAPALPDNVVPITSGRRR